jgi:hypothetical protein
MAFHDKMLPNPSLALGSMTGGPPHSVHEIVTEPFSSTHTALALPAAVESAPYFAALVTSS